MTLYSNQPNNEILTQVVEVYTLHNRASPNRIVKKGGQRYARRLLLPTLMLLYTVVKLLNTTKHATNQQNKESRDKNEKKRQGMKRKTNKNKHKTNHNQERKSNNGERKTTKVRTRGLLLSSIP